MNRDDVDWAGYFPAVVTPFTEAGDLDLSTLHALIEQYADRGMHGVVVNGTCGEWFSQSEDERRQVAETAVAAAGGRLRVLVGCTSNTAANVLTLGRHAIDAGVDGVLVSPPPYIKLFPNEVVAWYEEIGASLRAPLVVYNWPHGTGIDIGTELADRLADVDAVVAIKDSTPDADQFFETSRRVRDRVRVFGPYMSARGVEVLRSEGGDGTVGGGSLYGRPDPQFWEDHWSGNVEGMRAHAERSDRLFPKLWLPGGWAGQFGSYQAQLKALMHMLGQPAGHVRRPRLPITDTDDLRAMRSILQEEGLLAPDRVTA